MGTLTKDGLRRTAAPRMSGGVRRTALPLLRGGPDPAKFAEHRTADGRRVYLAIDVLENLAMLERAEHPVETACLLFGGFFSDGKRPCAIVTRLILPEPGEVIGSPSMVTITAEGAERMIARAWLEDPLLKPLGWGHTHPRFEAYFSHVDREEQRVWTEPASIGVVISGLDAPRNRYQVFVGPESEPAHLVIGSAEDVPREEPAEGPSPGPHRRIPIRRPRQIGEDWGPIALAAAAAIAIMVILFALAWLATTPSGLGR